MEFVWLVAPIGVLWLGSLLYALAPRYHESRAEQLLHRGRDRQAAVHFEAALKIWTRRCGKNSLAVVPALAGLARIRFLQGLPDRGDELLEEGARIASVKTRRPSRRQWQAWLQMGRAAHAAGRYAEAAAYGEQAAAATPRLLSGGDPAAGAVELLLAAAYSGQRLLDRAHVHYGIAIEIVQRDGGVDAQGRGVALASMAGSLARQELWREAREAGLEAVEILDQHDSTRLPEALNALAELHTRRGRLAEAEGLRVSICHLWERLGGVDSAALAREYELRAELLRSMERPTEASYLAGKAEKIRRTVANAC